jgi:hypothetical protein
VVVQLVDTLVADERMSGTDIAAVEFAEAVDNRMDTAENTIANLCQSLCRLPCHSLVPILFRIRASDSCILGQDSQHSNQQLFHSWVPSPKVLFYLLVAFFFTSIFVLLHIFDYCDNAQKYIKVPLNISHQQNRTMKALEKRK